MWKRILLSLLALVVLAAGGGIAWLELRRPTQVPAIAIRVEMSPARIARGKFLFENLCDCDGCHSERDFNRFGGPVKTNGHGKGTVFPAEMGMPGQIVAPNITPDAETGIGRWTDGEKIRAIREGVDRDGRALFPMMPYTYYRRMSDEDVQAVVAYMNSLAPIRNTLPETRINFPVNLMIKGVPQPVNGTVATPNRADRLQYGEYLATLGGCAECHTPENRGQLVTEKKFAGGRLFKIPAAAVVTANITPDPDTGIGKWTERHFLDKFAEYREYARNGPPPSGPDAFTLMPWLGLSQMPEEDLRAIYAYLRRQTPVHNLVDTHPGYPKKM